MVITTRPWYMAVALLACAAAVGHALSVTSQSLSIRNLNIAGGQSFTMAVFTVDFDGPVFIQNGSATPVPYAGLTGFVSLGGDNSKMPTSALKAGGSTKISFAGCSGSDYAPSDSVLLATQGPPMFLMNAPPADEPMAVFLSLVGGYAVNVTLNPNRWAGIYIINGQSPQGPFPRNIDPTTIGTCKPTITFTSAATSSSGVVLTDKNGNPFNQAVQFTTVLPPQCTVAGITALSNMLNNLLVQGANMQDSKSADGLQFLLGGLQSLGAWQGCINLVNTLVTFSSKAVNLDPTSDCVVPPTDPSFATDPCCNRTLAYSQCCAPKPRQGLINVLSGIQDAQIQATCSSPGLIKNMLYDFIQAFNEQSLKSGDSFDPSSTFQRYMTFQTTCNQLIYQQTCKSDADCIYSKSCDTQGGRCTVPWGSESGLMAQCFIDKMDPDLKLELSNMWGLSAVYGTPQDAYNAFWNAFSQNMLSPDCTGPMTEVPGPNNTQLIYHSYWKTQMDSQGNYVGVRVPGDQTGCLSVQGCNYDRWTQNTQQKCVQGTSNFCGQCNGNDCHEISVFPQCFIVTANDMTTCTQFGGTWSTNSWGSGSCTYSATTASTCLNSPVCPASGDNWRCGFSSCYNNNLNSSTCYALGNGYYWDANSNVCVNWMNNNNPSGCAGQSGFTYWPGRVFQDGRYADSTSCASGYCSIPYLRDSNANQSTCLASSYCTQNCQKCRTFNAQSSLCLSTETSATTCTTNGGNWNNGLSKCVRSNLNSQQCTAQGFTYVSCDQYDQNTCATGTYSSTLGCFWSQWEPCDNSNQCQNAGQCDDWEFQNCNGNQCIYGSCVFPFTIDVNGWPKPCSGRWSRLGCIDDTYTTNATCTAAGGSWQKKAFSQADCNAHGQACMDQWGNVNGYSAADCKACGLTWGSPYHWTQGQWLSGQWKTDARWLPRAWTSLNSWNNTIDWFKVSDQVNTAIGRMVARQLLNNLKARYVPLVNVFQSVACACGPDKVAGASCFSIRRIPKASCRLDPGKSSKCGSFSFGTNSVPGNNSVYIEVQEIQAGSVVSSGNPNARVYLPHGGVIEESDVSAFATIEVSPLSNTATYRVVKNAAGTLVGQLIGNAQGYTSSVTATMTCLTVNQNIDQDTSTYSVYDFAYANADGSVGLPVGITATKSGLQICGSVSQSGTYYPIFRVSNWQTYTPPAGGSSSAVAHTLSSALLFASMVLAFLLA